MLIRAIGISFGQLHPRLHLPTPRRKIGSLQDSGGWECFLTRKSPLEEVRWTRCAPLSSKKCNTSPARGIWSCSSTDSRLSKRMEKRYVTGWSCAVSIVFKNASSDGGESRRDRKLERQLWLNMAIQKVSPPWRDSSGRHVASRRNWSLTEPSPRKASSRRYRQRSTTR